MNENMNGNPTVNEFSNSNNGMNQNMNQGQMPNNGFNPNMNQGQMPNNGFNPNMNQGQMPNNGFNPNMNPYGSRPNGKGNKTGLIIGIVIFLIVIGVVVYLFLSGTIGGKTLTCSKTQVVSGFNITEKSVTKFKNNKASSTNEVINIKLEDKTYANQWNTVIGTIKSQLSAKEGVKVSYKDNSANYEYTIDATTDYSKVKDATISNADYETAKSVLAAAGYTCN